MIFPELDEAASLLAAKNIECLHPDTAQGYMLDVAREYTNLAKHDRLLVMDDKFILNPISRLAVILTDFGYPPDYAGRFILKVADSWPLVWPEWYGWPDSILYWERIEIKRREFCAQARIRSIRQGMPITDGAEPGQWHTVALPGLWSEATMYLAGLLVLCADPASDSQMILGL